MGITTIEGYRGAQLFEAVGFGPELMEFLGDFPSRARRDRLQRTGRGRAVAGAAGREDDQMRGPQPDYHAFNAKVRMALRDAVKEAHPEPEQGGGEMAYTAPPDEHDPDAPQTRSARQVREVHGHGEHPRADRAPRPVHTSSRRPSRSPLDEVQPAARHRSATTSAARR